MKILWGLFPYTLLIPTFILGVAMSQQAVIAREALEFTYGSPSFTPDSQKLVFDRCTPNHECHIHILDLKTGALTYYRPPEGQVWFSGKFSPDGKHVAFVAVPLLTKDSGYGNRDWANAQIALMDADGRNVRMLTRGPGYKQSPNFSWSGRKVIYVQGELRTPGSKTLAAKNDAFEIDLESGAVRQMTDHRFHQMGRPKYLPGDNGFVVDCVGPSTRGPVTAESMQYEAKLQKQNHYSEVCRFDAVSPTQALTLLFAGPYYHASAVGVDTAGNIYFRAQPNERDRILVYRYRLDGQMESWARKPHLQPRGFEISPDGRLWVELSRPAVEGDLNGIYMLDLTDGNWREIPANGSAQIINAADADILIMSLQIKEGRGVQLEDRSNLHWPFDFQACDGKRFFRRENGDVLEHYRLGAVCVKVGAGGKATNDKSWRLAA